MIIINIDTKSCIVKVDNAFDEEQHQRDEDGKFSLKDTDDRQQKINSVKIDFTKNNILPELNEEDLEELGKQSKPVLLKKSVIDRNRSVHSDINIIHY